MQNDKPVTTTTYRMSGEQLVELDRRLIEAETEWRSLGKVGEKKKNLQFDALYWLRLLLDEVKDGRWNNEQA